MTGVIICGGPVTDHAYIRRYLEGAGLVIAADSGAAHLGRLKAVPGILAGDFDSISQADYDRVTASGVETLRFPVEKDMTDSELAVELALERGCSTVVILGALGTRLDHSLSNVFLLKKFLERGAKGIIADEHNEVYLTDSRITLRREAGAKLSLLPLTACVKGVTTCGLYYPLKNATLEMGSSLGVSNEFVEEEATVTITDGLLLVIKARD
jgi:thiamine pyrophosphokinase